MGFGAFGSGEGGFFFHLFVLHLLLLEAAAIAPIFSAVVDRCRDCRGGAIRASLGIAVVAMPLLRFSVASTCARFTAGGSLNISVKQTQKLEVSVFTFLVASFSPGGAAKDSKHERLNKLMSQNAYIYVDVYVYI